MADQNSRSWEEVVDRLRRAAQELQTAAGQESAPSAEEEAAASRLKHDVTRLEQSAAELRSNLNAGFDAQRKDFETAVDRERAEQAAGQMQAALDELFGLAKAVTLDLKAAASTSLTHAQPELKTAIRTLEDVASSAGAWVRTVIDPNRETSGSQSAQKSPPLDDL